MTRISTGKDGRSHFRMVSVPMISHEGADWGAALCTSEVLLRISHRTLGRDKVKFHNPRTPLLVATLSGEAEVVCGDGSAQRFGPGDILLADDLEGEGHKTYELSDERRCLLIRIEPGAFDLWDDR